MMYSGVQFKNEKTQTNTAPFNFVVFHDILWKQTVFKLRFVLFGFACLKKRKKQIYQLEPRIGQEIGPLWDFCAPIFIIVEL